MIPGPIVSVRVAERLRTTAGPSPPRGARRRCLPRGRNGIVIYWPKGHQGEGRAARFNSKIHKVTIAMQ
jgi:hypothetical protein